MKCGANIRRSLQALHSPESQGPAYPLASDIIVVVCLTYLAGFLLIVIVLVIGLYSPGFGGKKGMEDEDVLQPDSKGMVTDL